MNTASFALCKELYELSGWTLTEKHWYKGQPVYNAPYPWDCPAYDLSVLLERLPQNSWVGYTDTSGQRGYALAYTYAWNKQGDDVERIAGCSAETPEDAACKLAIELFTRGILKRYKIELTGTSSGYIDGITGTQMQIESDNPEYPGHPKISVVFPEQRTLTLEELNAALSRLRARAKLPYEELPDLVFKISE